MDFAPDFTRRTFSAGDYVVFALMFLVSTLIGCLYFYKDRMKEDRDEFLIGGRSLSPYPVGLSLSVSVVTGTLVLGTPGDVYALRSNGYFFSLGAIVGLLAGVAMNAHVPNDRNVVAQQRNNTARVTFNGNVNSSEQHHRNCAGSGGDILDVFLVPFSVGIYLHDRRGVTD
ncbi:unnamed protein product [Clavelina lepadiformis]|uniref:Sodium-dependent multivitamin transporter n=1 Tax=Clavelina lepadiformis TaxID=159417 RepID=A0ABP0GU63_CLALP